VRRSTYPGGSGTVGGGLRNLPPKLTPVPSEGGWFPTTWSVPTVTSSSGLPPSRVSPTTPPWAPWPTEAEAASNGFCSGWSWLGCGCASRPPCPPGCDPPLPLLADPPAGASPDPAETDSAGSAGGAEGLPVSEPDPSVAAGLLPWGVLRPPVFDWLFEPAAVASAAAAPAAGSAPPDAPEPAPAAGPESDAPDPRPAVEDVAPEALVDTPPSSLSPRREIATTLASSTTRADAKASPTCALLRLRSANETTPDPPARLPANGT
jgi:hypothetical protein